MSSLCFCPVVLAKERFLIIRPPLCCLLCVQNDWGGQRTLQRKWTSFLKARMVCSVPEYELHLNILRSVFVLRGRDAQSSVLYGVFGLEW